MKILLVHKLERVNKTQVTYGAIPYYRLQKPMKVLNRMYPEIDFTTVDSINVPDEFLQEFDLILFCREITNPDKTAERLNKLGIPFGMDVDDYWHLDNTHILYEHYKKENIPALVVRSLSVAHFVTATTEILADKVRPINSNVHVIENGIDTDDPSWVPNKIKSDRIRFGFTGGNTHIHDLALVSDQVKRSLYDSKFYHKAQVALCYKADYHEGKYLPSVYVGYERMLTDNLKALRFHPEYCNQIKKYQQPKGDNMPYKQIWFRDVDVFGTVYDEMDIVVAPLCATEFNSCKSNIKMLEAGFKDCAVMVSNVSPYTPLATKENSFLLSEKNFFEWQRYIINNPNCLADKKAKLREDVEPFALKHLTKKRKELYEQVLVTG